MLGPACLLPAPGLHPLLALADRFEDSLGVLLVEERHLVQLDLMLQALVGRFLFGVLQAVEQDFDLGVAVAVILEKLVS